MHSFHRIDGIGSLQAIDRNNSQRGSIHVIGEGMAFLNRLIEVDDGVA